MDKLLGEYKITDDKSMISADMVKYLLNDSYWAPDRDLSLIQKTLDHSICVSVFHENKLIGFARVVTDQAVFAWIADVVVRPDHRGKGLGKAIMSFIEEHPRIPARMQILRTKDAHGLYEQYGFKLSGDFMIRQGI
ncbi:MAG: GNAT family N-acetyltransferase [Candidatus Marinimicrobia bacterium]|nr:GNAT family N-acetyltransferase [Candidatus Neomarinimicrobiota bacterium]